MMRKVYFFYWFFNVLLIPIFGIGSVIALTGSPAQEKVLISLGYPTYLLLFLSIAKILALIVIFSPKFNQLKEWAYAGLTFDVIGAIYSIIMVDLSFRNILIPMSALLILLISHSIYHKIQKHKELQRAYDIKVEKV